MTTSGLVIESKVHFTRTGRGRKELRTGASPIATPVPAGRTPRISRLMALAIRFEGLVASGEVSDYADLGRLGHVTRARVTQVMNLLCLAPDVQEALLFLPLTLSGRDAVKEWQVRPIAAEANWEVQRRMWRRLCVAVAAEESTPR